MKNFLIALFAAYSLALPLFAHAQNSQCENNPLACLDTSEDGFSMISTTPNPAGNESSASGGFWSDLWDNLFGGEGQGQDDPYGQIATSSSILGLLAFFLNVALGLVGILMLISLIYGGFLWMTALGEQAQIEKAKKIVMYTAIGFIVILSSFAIVNTLFGFQNLASLRLRFDVVNTIKSFF